MNFLMITYDFPPTIGGVETRAVNYVKNLIKLGSSVQVIAMTLRKSKEIFSGDQFGAPLYRCPSSSKQSLRVFLTLLKSLKATPIDGIVILTGANTLVGLLFLLYGKVKRIKTSIFLYGKDILSYKENTLNLILLHIALIVSDRIGVNSKATSRLLPQSYLRKFSILYPGVDVRKLKEYVNPYTSMESEMKILFVGRLIKRKGVDDLLHAFKQLLKTIPQAKLVIVGDGPEGSNLRRLVESLNIQDRVRFTGMLREARLYREYQECDVFVMPSKKIGSDVEGFGMVFLEAGFFKKPAVGTTGGGIPEAVVDGVTGLLVPEGDIDALKNALELLLRDQSRARRLGEKAYERVMSTFTWEKATLKLLQMFQR